MKLTLTIILSCLWLFNIAQTTVINLQPGPEYGLDADITNLPCNGFNICDTSCTALEQLMQANAWTWSGVAAVKRAFLKFDLSSVTLNPSSLISAEMYLYFPLQFTQYESNSTLSGSNALFIDRVTYPWTPYSIRNANQPNVVTTNLSDPGNRVTTNSTSSPTENFVIDITEMTRYWLNNQSANFGVRFALQTENYYRRVSFATSNDPTVGQRPKLKLTFNTSSTGFDNSNSKLNFTISPNPSNNRFTLETTSIGKIQKFEIYNSTGKLVTELQNTTIEEINTTNFSLASGLYNLVITNNNDVVTKKLQILAY
jgi:hypothetical protein